MSTQSESYTVGWICAIPIEYVVACELLDEEYDKGPSIDATRDSNFYTFGRIHEHNVVIACLPKGRYGTTSAAVVAERMRATFPTIRFGILVGIAGGAPSSNHDIRLGDVVVSSPTPGYGGVIQYDFQKAIENYELEAIGHLAPPPEVLLNAISNISMLHMRKGHKIVEKVDKMLNGNKRLRAQYSRPDPVSDRLYETSSNGEDRLVERRERDPDEDNPAIHYGLIASANRLIKDKWARDALIRKYDDVLCFEMEAAGLMNNFPCLVIRGICDYSDAQKNDIWQGYSAATAAAYAKELLEFIPGQDIKTMLTVKASQKQAEVASCLPAFSLCIDDPVNSNNNSLEEKQLDTMVYNRWHETLGGSTGLLKSIMAEWDMATKASLSTGQKQIFIYVAPCFQAIELAFSCCVAMGPLLDTISPQEKLSLQWSIRVDDRLSQHSSGGMSVSRQRLKQFQKYMKTCAGGDHYISGMDRMHYFMNSGLWASKFFDIPYLDRRCYEMDKQEISKEEFCMETILESTPNNHFATGNLIFSHAQEFVKFVESSTENSTSSDAVFAPGRLFQIKPVNLPKYWSPVYFGDFSFTWPWNKSDQNEDSRIRNEAERERQKQRQIELSQTLSEKN